MAGSYPNLAKTIPMPESADKFTKLCKQHVEILDGTQAYDEGDPQTQARRFWLQSLAQPVIEQARAKLQHAGKLQKIDLLISVSGFSPETTIITAGVFQPREVLVISSEESYEHIDTISEFLRNTGLRPRQFHHERCTAADLSLFEIICRRVKEHRQRRLDAGAHQEYGEILVDITGGKKLMSAGAAVAAWEMDLRICYIDNKFDPKRRIAVPGTENIVLLDSPYQLYGGAELQRADHDFDLGAYDVARSRYEKLAEKLNEPARARFLRDVSGFYEAWRNLDIKGLKDALPKVQQRLEEPSAMARTHGTQLKAQVGFVERLVKDERAARVMTLFLLGDANMAAKRYDFSALLFYRTIEASIASRLEQCYPGFLCEKADYTKINPDVEALRARFDAARKAIFQPKAAADERAELPHEVSCLDGALLLQAENDELLRLGELEGKRLASFPGLISARNKSILAHGYQSITEDDCKKLRNPAERLLKAYWTLNKETTPFEQAVRELQFLHLTSS